VLPPVTWYPPSAPPSVSEAIGPLSLRCVHPDPDGKDRLIGISAPSRGSCDCDRPPAPTLPNQAEDTSWQHHHLMFPRSSM
jgi:hypothetical protein